MSTNYPPPPPPPGGSEEPGHEAASGQGGYGQAPPPPPAGGYGQAPPPAYGEAPGPVSRPPAMDNAVRLMQVGGVVAIISVVIGLFSKGTIHDAIVKANENATATKKLTASEIDSLTTVSMVSAVVVGLIAVALWFWMASVNGKGKQWGRIVATVFFVLSVLSLVASLARPESVLTRILGLVQLIVGAAAIYFMYQKDSSEFYRASSAPRM